MKVLGKLSVMLLAGCLIAGPLAANAKQGEGPVIDLTGGLPSTQPISPAQLLRERVGGFRASSEVKEFGPDSVGEMVDNPEIHREYLLRRAASRLYGTLRADAYHVENAFAAFGLYSHYIGVRGAKASARPIGSDSAAAPGEFIFWRDNLVVRISDSSNRRNNSPGSMKLASEISKLLGPDGEVSRPLLLSSLPAAAVDHSKRYFLGPSSLSTYLKDGREMFDFSGRAEAVLAEYPDPTGTEVNGLKSAVSPAVESSPLKLLIVEYHTPSFATAAMARINDYVSSRPQEAQDRIMVKREGNYIVSAIDFSNREYAQQLVDSIKYPYTVKWLRNPLWPTNDPWRTQKAAQMLLSTFGILGLMVLSVLIVGGTFGTVVFLKRRKRQREIFSDAGGMLRLDLDPFDATILGLPPGKER